MLDFRRFRIARQTCFHRTVKNSDGREGSNPYLLPPTPTANIGRLRVDYEGDYTLEDTASPATMLRRAETDARFLKRLEAQGRKLHNLFTPKR
tara:strand:- start:2203 stop:2481 length:279 start_codon:yes stop_codon:yes gene_type:complete